MEKHDIQPQLEELYKNIHDACEKIEIDHLHSEVSALEAEMALPDFWDDQAKAQEVVTRLKSKKHLLTTWIDLRENIDSLQEMFDTSEHADLPTIHEEIHEVQKQYDQASFVLYFNGPHDKENVVVTITSGAGGDDAEDFAGMLLRMYHAYFEQKGFQVEVLEYSEGAGHEGIKKVSMEVKGEYVYGILKGERGVHRLVRLSPFKSSDSRQTSFVHVDIMPLFREISEDHIQIDEKDLKIDTFRASGAGGQKVNKTDSAVRITHIPTGIVVSCQVERSQHQNKERAMHVLKSKIYKAKLEAQAKEMKDIQGEVVSVDWGKQIRSYVLHPYKMVKDHRTNVEVSNVDKVLNGDLEEFIDAEIKTLIE